MTVTIMQAGCITRRITRPIGTTRIPERGNTITRRLGSRPTILITHPMGMAITTRLSIRGSPYQPGSVLIRATSLYRQRSGILSGDPPQYWGYFYSTSSWQYFDGTTSYPVSGLGDTYSVDERIEYWVLYYMNQYRAHPVSGPLGTPAVQPALVFNAAVDWMAEKHLQDILSTHVWAHESTAFPSGWQTLVQRGEQIGWADGQPALRLGKISTSSTTI